MGDMGDRKMATSWFIRLWVGMFPLILKVLNRDYKLGGTRIPIKDC